MARTPVVKRLDLPTPPGESRKLVFDRPVAVGDVVDLAAERIDRIHAVTAIPRQQPHRPIERGPGSLDTVPDGIAQRVLTQLIGSARARELYLLSPVLTAKEALALGMVTRVVPDAEIDTAAHQLAMSLAQGPSIALGYIKRNINNAEHMSLEACFDGEAIHHSRAGETADHKEAAKAFVEKRKPLFQGR